MGIRPQNLDLSYNRIIMKKRKIITKLMILTSDCSIEFGVLCPDKAATAAAAACALALLLLANSFFSKALLLGSNPN